MIPIQGVASSLIQNIRKNPAAEALAQGGRQDGLGLAEVRKGDEVVSRQTALTRLDASERVLLNPGGVTEIDRSRYLERAGGVGPAVGEAGAAPSFSDLLEGLVRSVDAEAKEAAAEKENLLIGKTDNIHQSIIAMQEASVAFSLLVEVRNKLVETYQELSRMQV